MRTRSFFAGIYGWFVATHRQKDFCYLFRPFVGAALAAIIFLRQRIAAKAAPTVKKSDPKQGFA